MRAHNQPEKAEKPRRQRPSPARAEEVHSGPLSAEEVLALQRAVGNAAVTPSVDATAVQEVLRSGGRPLEGGVRADMESRLGADLSDVRVHTGPAARESAAQLGARAYTSGSDVVLGVDGTDQHTLAHELTHVIQQRTGPVSGVDNGAGLLVSDPGDRFEREAEATATRVLSGAVHPVQRTEAGQRPVAGTQTQTQTQTQVQRFRDKTEGGVTYRVSKNGRFAVIDGARYVWAVPGAVVSSALARNAAGDVVIDGQQYEQYQISRWLLKDCLHTAEEIINSTPGELASARELEWEGAAATAGRYSRIRGKSNRWRQFGKSVEQNKVDARDFPGAKDHTAAPGIGEAYVILQMVAPQDEDEEVSPYHAAAVVGVDDDERVTLEEWDSRGQVARGSAHIYTVGDATNSFHGYWSRQYFGDLQPTTVVISAVADQGKLVRRAQPLGQNAFGDADTHAAMNWPASPAGSESGD